MPKQKSAYPECRHILTTGRKCKGPALKGRPFCHHHARQRNYSGRNQRSINSVELPPLEDHSSVVLAIDQIIFALTHRRITDELAARLLYAIQLAQNSLNRIKEVAPEEMVTDYVNGRFGDIAAPAEPGNESCSEPNADPADHDDFPLLSEDAKTHSGHGDTCWEPTNADYPGHAEVKQAPAEDQSVPAEPATIQKPSCHPEKARSASEAGVLGDRSSSLGWEGSAVAFQASSIADKLSAQPNLTSAEPSAPGLIAEPRPAGTRENSPGRQSRGQVANSISEVPEGRPNLNPPNPAPPKPSPQKSGPPKTGPWDNPLLDHIVHQLQSGMSEREVAAQLERDLRSGTAPA